MTENPEPEELVPVDDLTPEEANRIIHSHRKVRYGESGALYIVHSYLPPVQAYFQSLISADGPPGTACWPCRQRKVKCDNKQPCENCVKREHPQLCSYKPNRSSTNKSSSTLSQNSVPRKRTASFSDARGDEGRKSERQESWPRAIGT